MQKVSYKYKNKKMQILNKSLMKPKLDMKTLQILQGQFPGSTAEQSHWGLYC